MAQKRKDTGGPDLPDGPQWYTIRQAADYLGVSQPTIFRWMKEGILSFYKVGGGTRFSRENLENVIEKTTSRKEAAGASARCAACGHSVLVDGRVQATGRIHFRPDETRFWILEEGLVGIRARSCAACGFIQLFADPDKLSRLRPRADADEPDEDEPVRDDTV